MQTTKASIYDFPTYYDLVFGSDTAAEMRFLGKCFERFVDGPVKRVFEPACGTGRLIYRLGKQGYEVGGVDLNEKAIDYCNQRLAKHGLRGRAQVGDMSDFESPQDIRRQLSTRSTAFDTCGARRLPWRIWNAWPAPRGRVASMPWACT